MLRLRAIERITARKHLPEAPFPVPRCKWLAPAPAESRPDARAWEVWGPPSAAPGRQPSRAGKDKSGNSLQQLFFRLRFF